MAEGFYDIEGYNLRLPKDGILERVAACIKGGSTFDQQDRIEMACEIMCVVYEGLEQQHEHATFQMMMDAYIRGYQWRGENPDSEAFLHKAAYDYADKAISQHSGNDQ